MNKKNFKIEFAPDAFENFEGTQEELDEFIKKLTQWLKESDIYEDDEPQEIFVHTVSTDASDYDLPNQSKRLH
jgi:hypothetical protein